MLDTHAAARPLSDAESTPVQADAISNALCLAAERGDHVTSDQFRAGLAESRTEMAGEPAEPRLAELGGQIAEQRAEVADARAAIANLDTRVSTQIAEVRTEIANLDTRLSLRQTSAQTPKGRDMSSIRILAVKSFIFTLLLMAFVSPFSMELSSQAIEPGIEASAKADLQLYSRPPMRLWPFPFVIQAPETGEVVKAGQPFRFLDSREVYVHPERSIWWHIETTGDKESWVYVGQVDTNSNVPPTISILPTPQQ